MSESPLFGSILIVFKILLPIIYIIVISINFKKQKRVFEIVAIVLSVLMAISHFIAAIIGQIWPFLSLIFGVIWIVLTIVAVKKLRYFS